MNLVTSQKKIFASRFFFCSFAFVALFLFSACPVISPLPVETGEYDNCSSSAPRFSVTQSPLQVYPPPANQTSLNYYYLLFPFGHLAGYEYPQAEGSLGSLVSITNLYSTSPDMASVHYSLASDRFESVFMQANPLLLQSILNSMDHLDNELQSELCQLNFTFDFWNVLERLPAINGAFRSDSLDDAVTLFEGTHPTAGESLAIDTIDGYDVRFGFWFAPQINFNPLRMGTLSKVNLWAVLLQKIDQLHEDGVATHNFSQLNRINAILDTVLAEERVSVSEAIAQFRSLGYFDTSLSSNESPVHAFVWENRSLPLVALMDRWQATGFIYWLAEHALQASNAFKISKLSPETAYSLIQAANEDLNFKTQRAWVIESRRQAFESIGMAASAYPFYRVEKEFEYEGNRFAFLSVFNSDSFDHFSKLYVFDSTRGDWVIYPQTSSLNFAIFSNTNCLLNEHNYMCLTSEDIGNALISIDLAAPGRAAFSLRLEEIITIEATVIESFENITYSRLLPPVRSGTDYSLLLYDGVYVYFWDSLIFEAKPIQLFELGLDREREILVGLDLFRQESTTEESPYFITVLSQSFLTNESEARNEDGSNYFLEESLLNIDQYLIPFGLIEFITPPFSSPHLITEFSGSRASNKSLALYDHQLKQNEIVFLGDGSFLLHLSASPSLFYYSEGNIYHLAKNAKTPRFFHLYDVHDPESALRQKVYGRDLFWPLEGGEGSAGGFSYANERNTYPQVFYPGSWLKIEDRDYERSAITPISYTKDSVTGQVRFEFVYNWASFDPLLSFYFERRSLTLELE